MSHGTSLAPQQVAHLVFSTRAARPQSGTEFDRDVLAASPGVSEAARAAFRRLADMTGPVLRRPDLPMLHAARRVSRDEVLWVRARSLGLYRKGHHQLLIHGVVLRPQHLNWIDGNPFLLETRTARDGGFVFFDEHPEAELRRLGPNPTLPPLTLDSRLGEGAPRANRGRFESLSVQFRRLESVPALFDALVDRSRPLGLQLGPTGVSGRPQDLFEWLLLHLHPVDRPELSFHTLYAYESPEPFDLLGVAAGEDRASRRLDDLEIWAPDVGLDGPRRPGVGGLVERVRNDEPSAWPRFLETYYWTLFDRPPGRDFRDRALPVLTVPQAALCLRRDLAMPLSDEEATEAERLATRGGSNLLHHTRQVLEAWRKGPEALAVQRARLREAEIEVDEQELSGAIPGLRDAEERWALAVVLRDALLSGANPSPTGLAGLWRRIRPGGSVAEAGLFPDRQRAEAALDVLTPFADAELVAPEPSGSTPSPEPLWADLLRLRHRVGLPVLPEARRWAESLGDAPNEVAVAAFRKLRQVSFEVGEAPFGHGLLFREEVPRLDESTAAIRISDGVVGLLEDDEGVADEVLRTCWQSPDPARAAFDGLRDWLAREPRQRTARAQALLMHQPEQPGITAPKAAGQFLVELALSPAASALPRLLDGLTPTPETLLGVVARDLPPHLALDRNPARAAAAGSALCEARAAVAEDDDLDRALLDLLEICLGLSSSDKLRIEVRRYLSTLRTDPGRWVRLAGPTRWRHVLLDELAAHPPARPQEDSRYRAYHLLAWAEWERARRFAASDGDPLPTRRAEAALVRRLAGADLSWHRQRAREAVSMESLPLAEAYLDVLAGSRDATFGASTAF